MKDEKVIDDHMGRYPVVYLSLKECCSPTWAEIRKDIWTAVYKMCYPHISDRTGMDLNQAEWKLRLDELYTGGQLNENPSVFPESTDDYSLREVFFNLVEGLYRLTQNQVVVLVNEYDDAPMNVGFKNQEDNEQEQTSSKDSSQLS